MTMRIRKGDILLFGRGAGAGPGMVRAGQLLLSIGRNLDSSVTHIGIVTKGENVFSSSTVFPGVMVTHAVAKGIVTQRLDQILRYGYRSAMIFRTQNRDLARQAAAIAKIWAEEGAQGEKMSFASTKAALSPFGSARYGDKAAAQVKEYVQYSNTKGGPPSLKNGTNRSSSMFCSMFVVAVYQAALGEQAAATAMAVDARNTTPMKLATLLPTKGFTRIGNVFHLNGKIWVVDHTGREIEPANAWLA